LAILKINAEEALPIIPFGDSESLQVGEWVLAVGNPFDLTSTVTAGIVSAKARNINILRGDMQRDIFPVESFIQTDAAVNPGNSGGALVNAAGELIGINTAIASKTGSYSGYSFAVPTSIVRKVSEDLIAYGRVQRGFLGVRVGDMNQTIAQELGLSTLEGVYVSDLTEVGGAEEAGMQPGDVILEVAGHPVNSVPELQERISQYRPGETVEVLCIRKGQLTPLAVELRDASGSTRIVDRSEAEWTDALGVRMAVAPARSAAETQLPKGVEIVELRRGRFLEAGVRKGFVITKIDGHEVETPEDVIEIFASGDGGLLVEGHYPSGKRAYYGVSAQR
jgi:S1-C subfamily serine protease